MLPSGGALHDKACQIFAVCPNEDCENQIFPHHDAVVAYRFFLSFEIDRNCAVHPFSALCLCEDKVYPISAACPISVCLSDCTVSPIFPRQVCASRIFPNHDAVVAYRFSPGFEIDRNRVVHPFSAVCLCERKVSLLFPQVRANFCAASGLHNLSLVCGKLDVVRDSRD